MLYGKYQFLGRLETDTVLPYYKGSTFRGVFGLALKKVVCALKTQACSQCLLKQRCVYALVFETQPSIDFPQASRMNARPHPFVIEPPLTTETRFPEGASFDFNLLLFGKMNNNLPYFIYAFDRMGKIGIGKRINGKRGRFFLEEVKLEGQRIYSHTDEKLKMDDAMQQLMVSRPGPYTNKSIKLRVILETPLRLKFDNRLRADLPFHVLVRAMLRRVSTLLQSYGDGEPPLDYRGLVKRAEDVRIVEESLDWFDWRRYSHCQDREMLMGGRFGSYILKDLEIASVGMRPNTRYGILMDKSRIEIVY